MTSFRSAEILEFMSKNDCLISFEKAIPTGSLKQDFISLATQDGRAVGLSTPGGFSTSHVELPRVVFDDFMREGLIAQDRPEDGDGRIFFRLTKDGRARAAL